MKKNYWTRTPRKRVDRTNCRHMTQPQERKHCNCNVAQFDVVKLCFRFSQPLSSSDTTTLNELGIFFPTLNHLVTKTLDTKIPSSNLNMICCCTEKQSMFSISLKTKKEIPHRSKFGVSAQHITTKLQAKQNMLKTLKEQQEFSKLAMVFVPNAAGMRDGEIGNKKVRESRRIEILQKSSV